MSDQLLSFDFELALQPNESIVLPVGPLGINTVAFNAPGQTLAVTGFASEVWFLGLKERGGVKYQLGVTIDAPKSEKSDIVNWQISCMAFNDTGSCLWLGDTHGNIIALNNESSDEDAPFKESSQRIVATLNSRMMTIAFADGGIIIAGASNGETRRIEPGRSTKSITRRNDTAQLKSIGVSRDGQRMAMATSEGLRLFSLTEPVAEIHSEVPSDLAMSCNCVAWTTTGKLLAVGAHDGLIRVFDSETLQKCGQIMAHKSAIDRLSIFDDQIISTAEDGSIFSCPFGALLLATPTNSENDSQENQSIANHASCFERFHIPNNVAQNACLHLNDQRAIVWLHETQDSVMIFDRITGEPVLKLKLPFEKLRQISWEQRSQQCILTDQHRRQWTLQFPNKQ